jgi:hypothetical protein
MRRCLVRGVLLGALLITGCGRFTTAPPDSEISVIIAIVASSDVRFSAEFDGDTIRSPGAYTVVLSPGTYEIKGSYSGGTLAIGFSSFSAGGVEYGSVKSLSGPRAGVDPCQVTYSEVENTGPKPYRIEFRVTGDDLNACSI